MSLSLGLLGALAGGATGGMLRAGGSRALGAAAGAVGGGLGVSHAMKDVIEEKPNKNELSNAKMDEQWFKEHINIWRKVTEREGIWDRTTKDWKEKGDEYIKNPEFQEFVNSADVQKKKKLLKDKWFMKQGEQISDLSNYGFDDMHDNDYKNFIVSIAPQYERKDQFGHGTSIAPSGDPEFLGVKKEDVVRY
tara:strand:+ start:43 stop:618 length:576 start_codon:yes stop_codon:yes gene_type:complete